MNYWRNILALLIAPLGAPVSFTVWSHLAIDPRSFSGLLSSLPGLFRYATPVAYIATLLLGIPAIVILSRKKWLTLPVIVFVGTLIGIITGLFIGFYISGYDINGVFEYFTFDLISIYVPSTISGMVSSVIYWVIRTFFLGSQRK
jgi:hypothetical protein